jgi:hypothetical protein
MLFHLNLTTKDLILITSSEVNVYNSSFHNTRHCFLSTLFFLNNSPGAGILMDISSNNQLMITRLSGWLHNEDSRVESDVAKINLETMTLQLQPIILQSVVSFVTIQLRNSVPTYANSAVSMIWWSLPKPN